MISATERRSNEYRTHPAGARTALCSLCCEVSKTNVSNEVHPGFDPCRPSTRHKVASRWTTAGRPSSSSARGSDRARAWAGAGRAPWLAGPSTPTICPNSCCSHRLDRNRDLRHRAGRPLPTGIRRRPPRPLPRRLRRRPPRGGAPRRARTPDPTATAQPNPDAAALVQRLMTRSPSATRVLPEATAVPGRTLARGRDRKHPRGSGR